MKTIFPFAILLISQIGLSQALKKSEVVLLKNGHNVYYEVYGHGKPLFLLHGYTLSSKSWVQFIEDYSKEYEVYLVDLQGHGKSGPFKEDLSIKSVAKDIDDLIQYLSIKSIYGIGFSYGGDVLFQLEVIHPGLIKSMISIGACGFWTAKQFPNWIDQLSYGNIHNLKYMYDQHPDEKQIKIILDQFPNYATSITDEEMRKINSTVLITLGDADDGIPLEYLARVRKNLPKSYLWILPNTGHGAHYGKNKNEFIKTSLSFLQGEWSAKRSACFANA